MTRNRASRILKSIETLVEELKEFNENKLLDAKTGIEQIQPKKDTIKIYSPASEEGLDIHFTITSTDTSKNGMNTPNRLSLHFSGDLSLSMYGCNTLAKAIKDNNIRQLSLQFSNDIEISGAINLICTITKTSELQDLSFHFGNCDIRRLDLFMLLNALKYNDFLESLHIDLSHHLINDDNAYTLSLIIKQGQGQSLKKLSFVLDDIFIEENNLKVIFDAIQNSHAPRELKLSLRGNKQVRNHITMLADAIREGRLPYALHLNLNECGISSDQAQILLNAMTEAKNNGCATLLFIALEKKPIDLNLLQQFDKLFQENEKREVDSYLRHLAMKKCVRMIPLLSTFWKKELIEDLAKDEIKLTYKTII